MDSDSQQFEQAAATISATAAHSLGLDLDDLPDALDAIGYEAADPSLQAPDWHATPHGSGRSWR